MLKSLLVSLKYLFKGLLFNNSEAIIDYCHNKIEKSARKYIEKTDTKVDDLALRYYLQNLAPKLLEFANKTAVKNSVLAKKMPEIKLKNGKTIKLGYDWKSKKINLSAGALKTTYNPKNGAVRFTVGGEI